MCIFFSLIHSRNPMSSFSGDSSDPTVGVSVMSFNLWAYLLFLWYQKNIGFAEMFAPEQVLSCTWANGIMNKLICNAVTFP